MEPITKIATRQFKRFILQDDINLGDYDEIWAQIKKEGEVDPYPRPDAPLYKLSAVRIGKDEWNVMEEKRHDLLADEIFSLNNLTNITDLFDGGAPTPHAPPFQYEPCSKSENMTTEAVIALMKAYDPQPRHCSQHYTRGLAPEVA